MAKVIHFDPAVQTSTPPPEFVTLKLSGEEALFLRNLMGWCVDGAGPLRSHSLSIWGELIQVPGLKSTGTKPENMSGMVTLR